MSAPDTTDEATRRRRIRNTALRLTLFAILVYVGFIVAFVNRHS
jgi:fucose permease